jgi:hypothetical protein
MRSLALDVTLTGSLLKDIQQAGVSADAACFDNNETVQQWTVMVNNEIPLDCPKRNQRRRRGRADA